jgi:thiamine-phosphate pyrophosphorylase
MKLIIFTFPDFIENEILAISELFKNGLEILHLRKLDKKIEEVDYFLTKIPNEFHNKIVIHNHFSLLEKFELKGIHLNEKNRKSYNFKINNPKVVSSSFHSINEIENNNLKLKNQFEYIFLSPIFDSISKNNYNSNFSENELKIAFQKKIINEKVIALGGINLDNFNICKDLEFGGIGALGYFWKSFIENKNNNFNKNIDEIVKKFLELNDKCG